MTALVSEHQAPAAAVTDDPAQPVERAETKAALAGALANLSPRQLEVVQLKFQDGLRYHEIAQVCGISTGTVAKTMHEAMARLRGGNRLQEAIQ